MNAPHPYIDEEQRIGCVQAESFLRRVASGEPVECDDLAQAISIARFGSVERQRAFLARVQQELVQGARDA